MKALQIISDEYLEKCKRLSTEEILEFLEEFRQLLPESVYREQTERRLAEWHRGKRESETESEPR